VNGLRRDNWRTLATAAPIEDLEYASQIINEIGIKEFFRSKTNEKFGEWSLIGFTNEEFKTRNFSRKMLFKKDYVELSTSLSRPHLAINNATSFQKINFICSFPSSHSSDRQQLKSSGKTTCAIRQ
jgi:hypothetical protein